MTVAELIARLQAFDPSLRVVTGGFDENGFEDVGTVELTSLVLREAGKTHTDIRGMRPERVAQAGGIQTAVLINF